MTDKKNITRFSPKNLFLGEQKGVSPGGGGAPLPPQGGACGG